MKILQSIFNTPLLDSKITSKDTGWKEKWLGYLIGPAGSLLLNALLAVYLNVYFTDVLNLGVIGNGAFLTALPIVTNILVAVMNVVMGRVIDHTQTRQGKARPWLLVSAPLVTIAGILLFAVPTANQLVQIIWVSFSYNLYYSIASTTYTISHNLMVPLSTKDSAQRGQLSVFNQVTTIMVSGIMVALVFPSLVLPHLGVDKGKWILIMSILSVIVLPLELLEYFFTRERVTEASMAEKEPIKTSLKTEVRAILGDRYLILAFIYFIIYTFGSSIKNISLVYYSNYVLGTYNDGFTQMILSVIGGIPMGIGVFAVWPLAKRFGKRNLMIAGFVLYGIGSLICWLFPTSLPIVLTGQFVKNTGALPASYIFLALFADVLDHIELTKGFRSDGLAMSIYSIIASTGSGICTGIFNKLIVSAGYVAPHYKAGKLIAVQAAGVKKAITFSFVGLESITSIIIIIILLFLTVEKANADLTRKEAIKNKLDTNKETTK